MFFLCPHGFLLTSQKYACTWIGVNECVNVCALWWTGIPFWVYSHLTPSIPGIGSGFIALAMIIWIPKMTECFSLTARLS